MIKLLLPIIGIILVSGVLYLRFFPTAAPKILPTKPSLVKLEPEDKEGIPSSPDTNIKVTKTPSPAKIEVLPPSPPAGGPTKVPQNMSSEEKIKVLEVSIADLRERLANLEKADPAPTTTNKPPLYIPLGSSGSSKNVDWYTLSNYEISLDPAAYPGYAGMQLEVNFRDIDRRGTVYARLFNVTDNRDVSSAVVSTKAEKSTWVSSSSFKLSEGQKTYSVQIKSPEAGEVQVQSARIKVNF